MSEIVIGRINPDDPRIDTYSFDSMKMNYQRYKALGIDEETAVSMAGFHANGNVIPYDQSVQTGKFKRAPLEHFGAFQNNHIKGLVRIGEWTFDNEVAFSNSLKKLRMRARSFFVNYVRSENAMAAMEKGYPLARESLGLTALVAANDVDQLTVLENLLTKSLTDQDPSKDIFAIHPHGDIAREVTEAHGFVPIRRWGVYDGLTQQLFVREGQPLEET